MCFPNPKSVLSATIKGLDFYFMCFNDFLINFLHWFLVVMSLTCNVNIKKINVEYELTVSESDHKLTKINYSFLIA